MTPVHSTPDNVVPLDLYRARRKAASAPDAAASDTPNSVASVSSLPLDPIAAARLVLQGVEAACRGRREAAEARDARSGVVVPLPLDPLDAARARLHALQADSERAEARLAAAFPPSTALP